MRIVNNITQTAKKVLPSDFVHTTSLVQGAIKKGWESGKQANKTLRKPLLQDMYVRTKYMVKEVRDLNFETKDIPVVAAAIAYIAPIPIPGLTLYTYGIALGITKLMEKFKQK